MTRTMADGIIANDPPEGMDLYAGYDDGHWPDADELAARFHGKTVMRITVDPNDNEGHVLDVEHGDATPAEAVTWVVRRRTMGAQPGVYCDETNWDLVKEAFAARAVAPPWYWIAKWGMKPPGIPLGALGLQYDSLPGYDLSIMADYLPGVDPAPEHPTWPGRYLRVQWPHMTGPDVREWQAQMIDRGWNLGPTGADGDWGPYTDTACYRFQVEKGLVPDHVCGPVTWNAAFELPITSS